jgi:hypothetical protein
MHDDVRATKAVGSIGSVVNQGALPLVESRSISPGAALSKVAEDFEGKKNPKL